MARQYPIWNKIKSCIYASDKSYGVREEGIVNVNVGTSSSNSHLFLQHRTTCVVLDNGDRQFSFYVDGKLIRRGIVCKKDKKLKYLEVK